MKLLLIRPNDQKAVYGETMKYSACEPPYWAAVIATYCRTSGKDVEIYDAESLNASPEQAVDYITQCQPDLIGVIVTGSNLSASTQKMHGAGVLCRAIKSKTHTPIFMWGLHPSALPERTLREERIDYVMKGEGLQSIVALMEYLERGVGNLDEIKGLHYWKEGSICANKELNLLDEREIPSPAWELLPMKRYQAHNWHLFGENHEDARGRYAVLATSLGCPYACTFCAISTLFGARKVRYIPVEQVMADIDLLVNQYHTKYIKMTDECFVLNKDYINKLCDQLIARNYDLNIWGYARIDTVNDALLKKLKRAGITWLAYGVESGSINSLNGVAKGQFNNKKVKAVVQMTKDAGIHVLTDFMFGLPDDDMDAMQASFELSRELNPEWINYYVTMPYPGSQLYDDYIKSGEPLPDEWLAYAQYSFECIPKGTKYLSPKEVLAYRDWAFNAFFENNTRYFENIKAQFGESVVQEIKQMTKSSISRRLLGDVR